MLPRKDLDKDKTHLSLNLKFSKGTTNLNETLEAQRVSSNRSSLGFEAKTNTKSELKGKKEITFIPKK